MRAYLNSWEGRIMLALTGAALMIAVVAFVWPVDRAVQAELEQRWMPTVTSSVPAGVK